MIMRIVWAGFMGVFVKVQAGKPMARSIDAIVE